MVDDKPEATGLPPDLSRPKRAPPTIDLEATEIPSEPADTAASASDPTDGGATDSASTNNATAVDQEPPRPPARSSWLPTAIVAALVGALATCGIIGAAVLAGWPETPAPAITAPQPDTAPIEALTARLAKLEARPATPTATDSTTVARIAALEQTTTTLQKEIAALRAASDQLTTTVNDLKAAPRETSPPDLAAITARLSQIEVTTRALSAETAQHNAAPVDDKPLRRVVAVSLLDQQVRQGESYAAALTAAKPLVANPEALKPLDRFAATGMPSANTLSKELLALIAGLTPVESKAAEGSGILDRLQAGAERLVRIRRTDEAASGEGRAAVISRAAAAARRDDVATARRELNSLPAAERAAFQPWIARADARDAALTTSRQLAADAVAALSKPAP
jgi:hypothetical protein